MQSTNWAAEHCEALRELLAKGMSHAEAAGAINARFGTAYSRSAALGRARRMGLCSRERPGDIVEHSPNRPPRAVAARPQPPRESHWPTLPWPTPAFRRIPQRKLRCVEIAPRRLSLVELEPGDCRYPYGGDAEDEVITFCGHPRREGSSYCAPHFHLTRGPAAAPERASGKLSLRVVAAA